MKKRNQLNLPEDYKYNTVEKQKKKLLLELLHPVSLCVIEHGQL